MKRSLTLIGILACVAGFAEPNFDLARRHQETDIPPVDSCYGLSGYYGGVCRVDNSGAASSITFSVAPQDAQCIAYNSAYFQPAVLVVSPGQGSAGVVGIPGGVAIANTQLTVYGAGSFVMRGYNYAGKFWFTCTN